MAAPIWFLGSETDAAGFRLAGVATCVAERGEEATLFERVRREAQVLLVSDACARALPPAVLDAGLAAVAPLVLIVPRRGDEAASLDPAQKVRRLLGIEA
jgi:vacuolar-type H+-ATPase subunit F/Vma7